MEHIKFNLHRIVVLLMLSCIGIAQMYAQSMSDEQVLQYVVEEYQKGTSQAQIVTKLMQKGVDINQIRRVRQKYERQTQNGGLGIKDITGEKKARERLRKNNGQLKDQPSGQVQKDRETSVSSKDKYTEMDPKYIQMQEEMQFLLPDSLFIMLPEEPEGRKVFGRDIFNNK